MIHEPQLRVYASQRVNLALLVDADEVFLLLLTELIEEAGQF